MEHYICDGGCGGVSNKPGVCDTSGCTDFGRPLEKCSCQDGKHGVHEENYFSEDEEAAEEE